jgi:hypothetical protein
MNETPKVTGQSSKTVVITLKVDTDAQSELYGRISHMLKSIENSAEIINVEVKDAYKITTNIRGYENIVPV